MDYTTARSWPFQEARALLAHIETKGKVPGDLVTFETGYGPSGRPHIGTFGEVVRTLWVMRAFREITGDSYPTRLIMFSDDYDALRKVPDDQPEWMKGQLGRPLTSVPNPNPQEPGDSFGHANNLALIRFVNQILEGFDGSQVSYTSDEGNIIFHSATDLYKNGRFNGMLDRVWENYQAIQDIILPTMGEERRATYSPFILLGSDGLMIHSGVERDSILGQIQHRGEIRSIHNGNTKLQWYVDWAMRWTYFDVDYEMSGKDLIDSVRLSSQICRVLGGTPPLNLTYELFLDEQGAKISKTKGNGFTIEEWLEIGSRESLQLFMFQDPRKAKKLYRDLVPQIEDQYLKLRTAPATLDDPHWHFSTNPLTPLTSGISYQLLLNLAIVCQAKLASDLLSYLEQNREIPRDEIREVENLAGKVVRYAQLKGLYDRELREPSEREMRAFGELAARLSAMPPGMDPEAYQFQVYEVGKKYGFEPLRSWFQALYECFLGSKDGPRFGAFTAAYGVENTVKMLRQYEESGVEA